jgi:hypothetical protein
MLKESLEAHIKTLTMRALEQNTPEESIHVD